MNGILSYFLKKVNLFVMNLHVCVYSHHVSHGDWSVLDCCLDTSNTAPLSNLSEIYRHRPPLPPEQPSLKINTDKHRKIREYVFNKYMFAIVQMKANGKAG